MTRRTGGILAARQSDWGPAHPCSFGCGVEVQVYYGPRVDGWRTFVAGTWERHRCPRVEIPNTMECATCGEQIEVYRGGRRFDTLTGAPHACPPRHSEPVAARTEHHQPQHPNGEASPPPRPTPQRPGRLATPSTAAAPWGLELPEL